MLIFLLFQISLRLSTHGEVSLFVTEYFIFFVLFVDINYAVIHGFYM